MGQFNLFLQLHGLVLVCLKDFRVVLFNDVFHVGSAIVAYFGCVGVEYLIKFVVLCKVLLDQFQKCFSNIQTTSTRVCGCWTSTYMDDRRTHSTHHERNSCRKLQTYCLPPNDVETVDKYILSSNVATFELPGIIAK